MKSVQVSKGMGCWHRVWGQLCLGVHRYCARLQQPSFWGGEVEILVLSRMLKVPIYVYKSAQEAGRCEPS